MIQTGSQVTSTSFKLEFKLNEILVERLTASDLGRIQSVCNELIEKKLPIYLNENVDLESVVEKRGHLKYPVRVLNDVLYPVKVRVISVGDKFENFERGKLFRTSNLKAKKSSKFDFFSWTICTIGP